MPTDIDVATLIGNGVDGDTINVPIWRCDTTTDDGCLNPTAINCRPVASDRW
jgi:conjugative transfer pilus assembly protein TraH